MRIGMWIRTRGKNMNGMPTSAMILLALCFLAFLVERNWRQVWSLWEARRVARNRQLLAQVGITPEEYMSTINPADYQSYAEAVNKFWPRRDDVARRNASLDRINRALGPSADEDIRKLRYLADRLDGIR